jgi:hypothetical protein
MTKQGSLSDSSRVVDAVLEICYRRIKVLPPIGKQSRYRAHSLTVVHARACNTPANRKSIDWKLITDSPICNLGLISRPKDMGNRKLGSSLTDNIVNVVEFRISSEN